MFTTLHRAFRQHLYRMTKPFNIHLQALSTFWRLLMSPFGFIGFRRLGTFSKLPLVLSCIARAFSGFYIKSLHSDHTLIISKFKLRSEISICIYHLGTHQPYNTGNRFLHQGSNFYEIQIALLEHITEHGSSDNINARRATP